MAHPRTPIRRTPWPAGSGRPVGTPIQPSVVYASDGPDALDAHYNGTAPGYVYAREGHPNADLLAAKIDALEGAEGGLVVGSGMAAVSVAIMALVRQGDHVLGGDQLYGRSLRLMKEDLPRFGVSTGFADPSDIDAMRAAIRPETRVILIEVVSNPTLRIADVDGIAVLARQAGATLIVDNTFTTPMGFRPFDRGAAIVVHSVTKLLAGHSDVTLGYVAARDAMQREAIRGLAATLGLTPSPFDCWLAERGLYTFEMRYRQAEANACELSDFLGRHPAVSRVLHPLRDDHPDRRLARDLLGGRGSHLVSFEIAGGRSEANALVEALPNIAFAPTLGDIGTTLSHPATSSHRGLTGEERTALGITEGFFRISVGCEPVDLLIAEFERALDRIS